jgi:HD superfamily phosphodiesterase
MKKIEQKLIKDAEIYVMKTAKSSPLDWFFELHQKEIIISANDLLREYPNADKNIVLLSCWLHDLGHFKAKTLDEIDVVKPNHHLVGAKMAEKFLLKYKLPKDQVDKVINCIICHRGSHPYIPTNIEEKIVAVADTLSHFQSIFYLLFFKIYPKYSLDEFVVLQRAKLKRDWRDLSLLPKAQEMVKDKYNFFLQMLDNYQK